MSSTARHSSRLRKAIIAFGAGALLIGLAACSPSGDSSGGGSGLADAGAEGIDDGTTLTLWTRAPLEKQANLLVDAYNASHKNQVELTVVPNDDYVAKVGAAAGSNSLPDLFAADIVYVPNWVKQGLFQDMTANIDGLLVQGLDQQGPPHGRHARQQGVRAAVRARPLDAVLEQGPRHRGRPRRGEGSGQPRRSSPSDAKAVQALNKPDTYGTATGLNCGGCLVFTWFPSVWADGDQVMNPEGTESLLNSDTAKERLRHVGGPLEVRSRAPGVEGRGRPDLDRRVHRRARSASCPTRRPCSRRPRSTSASRASPDPRAADRRSSAATASASRRTPRRVRRRGTSSTG